MSNIVEDSAESDSFKRAYDTYYLSLVKIIYRITGNIEASEDICQEAFIKLHEKELDKLEGEKVFYWLIRVAKNLAFNYEKRKGRERRAYERVLNEPKEELTNEGEKKVEKDESYEIVQQALLKLPKHLRAVLILKEYNSLNYKQIAHILKIGEGNVKVRVFRARENLKEILRKEGYNVS